MILLLFTFLFASDDLKCGNEKQELYVSSQELKRIGDQGINGLKLSNLLACEKALKGRYEKDKDRCVIQAEVCYRW